MSAETEQEERRLAAIMFTDMVGYSALSQNNPKIAVELLEEHRALLREIFPRFNGSEIFRADLFPAVAANPFLSFFTVASESGAFEFEWIGDNGFSETARYEFRFTGTDPRGPAGCSR